VLRLFIYASCTMYMLHIGDFEQVMNKWCSRDCTLRAKLAPAAEILTGGIEVGATRYATLRAGTRGVREFLGLVGNRSVQMDHVFGQAATGGSSSYWNLYPTSATLNRLMGQANNWTLSTRSILKGALARFINNGKLGGAAGASLFGGQVIGGVISGRGGCN
jgi:hypothetical protein